ANPNGSSTSTWFEWGTSSTLASYSSTPTAQIGSGTTTISLSEDLSGLSPNTTYYFRIAASNSGETSRGSILSFTTQPPVAVPTEAEHLAVRLSVSPLSLQLSLRR